MSFEINGNSATITKRRTRDKPNPNRPKGSNKNDFPFHTYNNMPGMMNFPNPSIPEHPPYYFPVTYPHQMTTEPMSLPVYPFAYPTIQYSTNPNVPPPPGYVNSRPNKYTVFQNNDEYTSLPIGNCDQTESSSDKRRFSDPGLPCDSDSSSNSLDDRLVNKLTQQVNALKESNRKLNKEVVEMRVELNMLKQQQNSRYFDRDYEPGMLAEIIKEIRDAARVREDALLAKVKHMIEEKQFSMNQMTMTADKTRNNERLAKLEEQLKNLTVSHNRSDDNVHLPILPANIDDGQNSARQVIELEREALVLRRELQDARAKKEETDQKLLQLLSQGQIEYTI
ncbi:hypothetical protein RN001_000351 [Aquatica leii]|uniref:Uncharacterized protein n=1 Tax=Aquatica leii TaxID=1421715 RepID=A0AAN7P9T5_9COLE|nr:hypothetical protein RN001_000351 [Aquatica leii]